MHIPGLNTFFLLHMVIELDKLKGIEYFKLDAEKKWRMCGDVLCPPIY